MPKPGKWRTYAQHECLYLCGPFYSGDFIIAALNYRNCPKCGGRCDLNARDTWAKVVRRRISDATWFFPWTWGKSHFEYKQIGHLADGGFDHRANMRNARQSQSTS